MSQQRYTIARLTHEGEHFEILVKPDPALGYRLGKIKILSEALVSDTIYTDANKGTKPSEDKLKKAFGTTDSVKIAEHILRQPASFSLRRGNQLYRNSLMVIGLCLGRMRCGAPQPIISFAIPLADHFNAEAV